MRNVLKATTLENRFPLLAVEEGVHPLEGRRHHGRLSGGLARTLYGDKRGVCCHPFGLGKGNQGVADLQCRAQAGLVCQGRLSSGLAKGGYGFPLPQFRAALQ